VELVGDIRQRDVSDAEPTQVVDARGQRPNRRIDPARGGLV
jgi:hypothetical protein